MKKALLVIDPQNDYLPDGRFPLWNMAAVVNNIKNLIIRANEEHEPVFIVQHIADPSLGIAPFFNEGTGGERIIETLDGLVPKENTVIKHYADGFYKTELENVLSRYDIDTLDICGMMTQNCVTHTAISPAASKYDVRILQDACTTTNESIHLIALNAISTRQVTII